MSSSEKLRDKAIGKQLFGTKGITLLVLVLLLALGAGYLFGANRPRPEPTLADFAQLNAGSSDSEVIDRFGPGVRVEVMPAAAGQILISLNGTEGSLPIHCRRYQPEPTTRFEQEQIRIGSRIEAVACFSKGQLFAVVTDRPSPGLE